MRRPSANATVPSVRIRCDAAIPALQLLIFTDQEQQQRLVLGQEELDQVEVEAAWAPQPQGEPVAIPSTFFDKTKRGDQLEISIRRNALREAVGVVASAGDRHLPSPLPLGSLSLTVTYRDCRFDGKRVDARHLKV